MNKILFLHKIFDRSKKHFRKSQTFERNGFSRCSGKNQDQDEFICRRNAAAELTSS